MQQERGGRSVNPKHPQAGANRRNAPKAKMVNQRLKDNLGQISEHQYCGRKLSNYSKAAEGKWGELQDLCWRRWEIDSMWSMSPRYAEYSKRKGDEFNVTMMSWFRLLSISKFWSARENREMQMCHILWRKKEIWKWSFENGRKDEAHPSPEIWSGVLKGWHNKVGGRSFILIEIHESLCLTHV